MTQPANARLLLVEDDPDINQLICLNLEALGYEVVSAHDGESGYQYASTGQFDLIILDLMLPKIDGLTICKQLRQIPLFTPIVMLTAKNTEAERVLGLEVGADDYLTKPFSILELQARVKAMLRRVQFQHSQQDEASNQLVFADLVINIENRDVTIDQQPINLTAKEFDLLLYLAVSAGKVFSRSELLDAVWGYKHSGYEHTVNSHINRLRAKIEQDPAAPRFIATVWGVGYKFNG